MQHYSGFSAKVKECLDSSLTKGVSKEEINSLKLKDRMPVAKQAQRNI